MFDTFNEVYQEVKEAGQADVFYPDFDGTMKTAITVRQNLLLKAKLLGFFSVLKSMYSTRAEQNDTL